MRVYMYNAGDEVGRSRVNRLGVWNSLPVMHPFTTPDGPENL